MAKKHIFIIVSTTVFYIKDCKIDYLTVCDSICLISMLAHDLSVQNNVNAYDCK